MTHSHMTAPTQFIEAAGVRYAKGQRATPAEPRLFLFFDGTESSQRAGRAFITRQRRRTAERDPESSEQTVAAQLEAIVRWGGSPTEEGAVRLEHISQPVLIVNGKSDVMVPTINSFVLFQRLPNARLSLYPDSGHGALFQYADAFVREGLRFLEH